MYKLKLILITIFAIGGAFLIYNHFDKPKQEEDINEFSKEYTEVSNDNIYKISSIDEVLNTLSEGTGIIFLCTPESIWCHKYAYYLNEGLKEFGISEVLYLNIVDYRELNTVKYQKLVDLLSDYLYSDDTNNKKIYMPDLTFVKDGIIKAHNNQTSLVQSDQDPENYWNKNRIIEFKNNLKNYILEMNKEIEEE